MATAAAAPENNNSYSILADTHEAMGAECLFYQQGAPAHSSLNATNVSLPATELLLGRHYVSQDSDEAEEEWKEEVVLSVSDIGAQGHLTEVTASEPELTRADISDMGLQTTTSAPEVAKPPGVARRNIAASGGARMGKSEDLRRKVVQGMTNERGTVSEGVVKEGERSGGRQRILEFGRSLANLIARPFRRQSRRREVRPTTESVKDNSPAHVRKPEDVTKMEEARLPAEILDKQFEKMKTTTIYTPTLGVPLVETEL